VIELNNRSDQSHAWCGRTFLLCSQKATKDPLPTPKDVQLEGDSWLASLATGEMDAATSAAAASLLLQAALAAAAVVVLLV
jgi:hypothetical protein